MKIDLDTLQRWFAEAPFMADLGVVPSAAEPGHVHTALTLAPRHLQHHGVVHAGVMASMADHTMGAAAQSLAAEGFAVLTAELKTSLLRAAKGERLECHGYVIKPGRSVTFTEAEVHAVAADGQRSLVMKASATMALTAVR